MNIMFKLEDFEGPLDLLLHLLEKNKMSIYDIEISSITNQYMEYIDNSIALDLEPMSEFIVMASTLLYIKSKMLLPRHNKSDEQPEEDPREELIRKLLEYKKIKYVSEELKERQNLSADYCFRNKEIVNDIEMPMPTSQDILEGVSLEQLYETFQALLRQQQVVSQEKERKIDSNILRKDTYTIEQKSLYILNLVQLEGKISFFELCKTEMPKVELIVTFMAILELVHKKEINIYQQGHLTDIIITGVDNDEEN